MASALDTTAKGLDDRPIGVSVPAQRAVTWWALVAAAAMAAGLLWFGTGLTPVPALTWLAPLPVFAIAARTHGWAAACTATAAWLAASLNMWTYFHEDLQMPAIVVVAFLSVQAAIFALTVVVFRSTLRRRYPALAVVGAAATWAAGEFLVSLVSPGGAFSSLAYTQAELLPVVQLASATGVWGISFVLMAVPAAVGALCAPDVARAASPRLVAMLCVVVAVTLGYGFWQLRPTQTTSPVTIGLIDVRQTEDSLPWASTEGRKVFQGYLDGLPALATSGATIAVLPEKVFKVTDPDLAELSEQLTRAAAANRMTIVIGLTLKDAAGVHNVGVAYSAEGYVRYDKQHLVPGWEDHMTPGDELAFLPGTAIGIAICKDMDYPALTRKYARQGGKLLLVPALDVDRDGWLHSRMALVRGIETGTAVARSADHGRLTASDAHGRIVADATTMVNTTATTVAVTPGVIITPYARFGDWFGWLCAALAALIAFVGRLRTPRSG